VLGNVGIAIRGFLVLKIGDVCGDVLKELLLTLQKGERFVVVPLFEINLGQLAQRERDVMDLDLGRRACLKMCSIEKQTS
jgi:hypothetical protein